MDYVSIVVSVFLVELVADYFVLKIFKINFKPVYLLFLQVPKMCASVICLFYSNILWLCILSKFLSKLICVIFIADSFKVKRLASLLFCEIIFLFSIGGFFEFFLLCINSGIEEIFLSKVEIKHQFLMIFAIILYIFAFFKFVRYLEKNKFLKKFLAKVSFFFMDKHINFYGLIDSGNSLLDPISRLPVVLVSVDALRKFFSRNEIEVLMKMKTRKISCDTVSGSGFEIPIFRVKNFIVGYNGENKRCSCLIGVVEHSFEKGKVDCLLHRDFI